MGLTPSATDKNRKSELARRKRDPLSFGEFGGANKPIDNRPPDWKPNSLKGSKTTTDSKFKK